MTKGYIHSLESFGSVDGPGVRYLIFTTGCAMRCQFCHNPDTWNMNSGTLYTADELIDKAWKYRTYWGSKGGITVSGGEPLLQIDFLLELFQKAKERGINTTLDTCGNPFTREEPFFSKFQELMKVTDLVMLDIKHIDDEPVRRIRIFLIWQNIFQRPENQSGSVMYWSRKEVIKTNICIDFMILLRR